MQIMWSVLRALGVVTASDPVPRPARVTGSFRRQVRAGILVRTLGGRTRRERPSTGSQDRRKWRLLAPKDERGRRAADTDCGQNGGRRWVRTRAEIDLEDLREGRGSWTTDGLSAPGTTTGNETTDSIQT